MEMVVTEGTAKKVFKGMPFKVAGKTGTAHVKDGKKIEYDDGVYQASFVGYFPADNPQYTCIVVIRTKPHAASHFGGTLAAPVFKQIAEKLYALYVEKKNPYLYTITKDSSNYFYAGFTSDIKNVYSRLKIGFTDSAGKNSWSKVYAGNYQPVINANYVSQQVMPDLKGMGVKVSVKGRGKIKKQSVAPGTDLAKGIKVILELS
jgi:cell division protein FtsI (penicillin-binding protein 3)